MPPSHSRLTELATVFLKLGTIGFGTIVVIADRLGLVINWQSIAIAIISWLLIWRWRINAIWLISGSAIVRLVRQFAQFRR